MSFYMTYLARWPDYFHVAEGPGNRIMGYSMFSPSSFYSPFVFVLFFFIGIRGLHLEYWFL